MRKRWFCSTLICLPAAFCRSARFGGSISGGWLGLLVGIYEFGLKSGEAEFLTKVNGFSESNVVSMGYSSEFNTLVIAYKSGDIDLLKGNSIINLPGIKRSTIFGSKDIYEVYIYNQYAYLSTAFGIVVIDLVAEEIIDDYQNLGLGGVPIAVNSLAIFNEIIYRN